MRAGRPLLSPLAQIGSVLDFAAAFEDPQDFSSAAYLHAGLDQVLVLSSHNVDCLLCLDYRGRGPHYAPEVVYFERWEGLHPTWRAPSFEAFSARCGRPTLISRCCAGRARHEDGGMTEQRTIASSATREDEAADASIRPKRLADYLGQQPVRDQMEIYIQAAKARGEAMDHVLIFGPPGLGKTTLSHVIANELGVNLRVTSGPVIEKAGDLAALLTNLQPHDVLFIDEIHRLSPVVEEVLYPAMEDFQIDIMIGDGLAARSIKIDLPPFTLIGATTRAGLLTAPLRDRFGIVQRLEFYSPQELTRIVIRSAAILGIDCTPDGAAEIAPRARHAAHCQPAAAAGARFRPGQGRRPHRPGGGAGRHADVEGGSGGL